MIRGITIINANNETFDLALSNLSGNGGLAITNIDGLTPPNATLNFTELSSIDGSVFNSGRIANRNIVITFKLLDDPTIELARQRLYRMCPLKSKIELQIHTDTRDVYAIGYVESNSINIFSEKEEAQVSIMCPDPYLRSTDIISAIYRGRYNGFEFPFSNPKNTKSLTFSNIQTEPVVTIDYPGEIEVGTEIIIEAHDVVTNISISNETTDQIMTLDSARLAYITGSGVLPGDVINICTIKGQKSAKLYRSGTVYTIISCFGRNTDWLYVKPGENTFIFGGEGISNMDCEIRTNILYEGV